MFTILDKIQFVLAICWDILTENLTFKGSLFEFYIPGWRNSDFCSPNFSDCTGNYVIIKFVREGIKHIFIMPREKYEAIQQLFEQLIQLLTVELILAIIIAQALGFLFWYKTQK